MAQEQRTVVVQAPMVQQQGRVAPQAPIVQPNPAPTVLVNPTPNESTPVAVQSLQETNATYPVTE